MTNQKLFNVGKENEVLEFKESTAEFDKAIRAIVAMLNKSGHGTIYFGVKDNGDVIGHEIGKNTLSNLTDRIKNSIKPSFYPTLDKLEFGDKEIIAVTFSGNNKPYAYKGRFYIRMEQQNIPIDPLVIRELIKESHEYNDAWENELTEFNHEYIDDEAVDMFYRQAIALDRVEKFDHTSEELLTQLGLMKNGYLNNAGLYLFGKSSPLVYKAVEYPTTERLDPIDLKRFEGNIFNLILKVINFISQKMRWEVKITDIQRKEIPEVPIVAIREIVINSLVHSDFHADTEHQVTIDHEVIEIYSPGNFGDLTPLDYVNKVLPSRTKHKLIQGVLFKGFDIETLGRGFKRTDNACKKDKIKWSYTKIDNGFSIIFFRDKNKCALSLDAFKIIEYLKNTDGKIENIDLVLKILNKKERSARKIIKELIDASLIIRVGSNKDGYWKLKEPKD